MKPIGTAQLKAISLGQLMEAALNLTQMPMASTRDSLSERHPYLTEAELDQACENLSRFVRMVREYALQIDTENASELSPNADSTRHGSNR